MRRNSAGSRLTALGVCAWVAAATLALPVQGENTPAPVPSVGADGLLGWPYAFQVPEKLGGTISTNVTLKTADLLVWTPPGAKRIRSIFVIPNNSDSKDFGQCEALRKAAVKAEMGIVYMRRFDTGIEWELKGPPDTRRLPDLMTFVAEATGIAEFRYAPWITFGKSSRGSFPYRVAWLWPERTIASVTYHGETPTFPEAAWAQLKDQTILEVNANGETEWGGTWFVHVRPSLLNYRARKNWLAHQVVAWGVGHGDYPEEAKTPLSARIARQRIWEYLALFIGKANELRVPKDKYPTESPVELKTVDEAGGYLIDPFAVEDLFFKPRNPLSASATGEYLLGSAVERTVSGYVAVAPAKDSIRTEGAPVSPLKEGISPSEWLVAGGMPFAMKNDPMTDLGGLEKVQPKSGDPVVIDGVTATFAPLAASKVRAKGGLSLQGGGKRDPGMTVLAYTVLDVAEPRVVKLKAPFSVAGRLQIVLNGAPVAHNEVVDLQKGLYPMFAVLSLNGVTWPSIEPLFEAVGSQEIDEAKTAMAEKRRQQVEQAKLVAAGPKPASALIHKATDVPKEERKKMFWVADREQAEAWFNLHALKGQTFDVK